MLPIANVPSVTPSGGSGPFKDPGDAFRLLSPSEQQLACVCAVLGGANAEGLIEGLIASKAQRLRDAIRALLALDQRHRLKVFSRSMSLARPAATAENPPARIAAVLTLSNPGRDSFNHPEANRLLDEAQNAHPALRTYAVRSRR